MASVRCKQRCEVSNVALSATVRLIPFHLADLDRVPTTVTEALACFGSVDIMVQTPGSPRAISKHALHGCFEATSRFDIAIAKARLAAAIRHHATR